MRRARSARWPSAISPIGPGSETYRVSTGSLAGPAHRRAAARHSSAASLVRHTFPADGEYVFQVKLFRTNTDAMRGLQYPHELEITVDGERVYLGMVGGDADFRALYNAPTPDLGRDRRAAAGAGAGEGRSPIGGRRVPPEIGSRADTRLLRPYVRSSADTYDFTGRPHISTLTVAGPFNATGVGDTPSRRRIFACRPSRHGQRAGVCAHDPVEARRPRLPRAGDARGSRATARVLSGRPS